MLFLEKNRKKKVTMKDISQKLNISVNAVSLALNDRVGVSDDTRALVFRTAAELGYFEGNPVFPGGSISKNICLMIESKYFKDINFYSKVILGIENEARKNGNDIIVNFMDRSNFIVPSAVENRKVSGILIVGAIEDEYLGRVLSYGMPIVLVDHASLIISTDAILTENIAGAYKATDYLCSRGHRDIGFFGSIDFSLSFKERWLGFYERMRNTGFTIDDLYARSITGPIQKYVDKKDYNSISDMINALEKMPSAWVCANDDTAIALYNALNLNGFMVPEDVSIIGFDDIDLCKIITPHLTTIRVNKELMGQRAVKRLMWRMKNIDEQYENIRMEVSLIERDSVKTYEGGMADGQ